MITYLSLSFRVSELIMAIFAIAFTNSLFSKLSKYYNSNIDKFRNLAIQSIKYLIIILFPIILIAIKLRLEIIVLLFERGQFNRNDSVLTSNLFSLYAIGIIGSGLRYYMSRIIYSTGESIDIVINNSIAFALNILLSLFLSNL